MIDFHNGFGSMVQGHAHPAIVKAVAERDAARARTSPRRPRTRSSSARSSKRRWGLPQWRYVNSGSEATMDAIRIARANTGRDTIVKIFGSYHGHHDYVMVSIGVPYDKIGDRDNYASLPYGAGIPQAVADLTIAVPFNDADAMERRIERLIEEGRKPACVIMEAAMMNLGVVLPGARLPRGRARAHAQARHRPDLRRGQDRPLHRARRRDRALRRHARHGHAGQGARRRPAVRRHRRHRGGHVEVVENGNVYQVGTYNGNPLVDGGGPRQPARRADARRPTRTSTRSTTASSPAATTVLDKYHLPGYTVGIGSKGCVTFSPTKIIDYATFKAQPGRRALPTSRGSTT